MTGEKKIDRARKKKKILCIYIYVTHEYYSKYYVNVCILCAHVDVYWYIDYTKLRSIY